MRAEVCRQTGIFESTTNQLMMETSRVRDAATLETERLPRELTHNRDVVDQLRVERSDAKEESAGLRAQAESAALRLRHLQKANEKLETQPPPVETQKSRRRATYRV